MLISLTVCVLGGCNANAWMGDPSSQGYYKPTPTTIPILDRIDIIEDSVALPQYSKVTDADLMPSDLRYKIASGDTIDLEIYGLYQTGQHYPVTRRVDQGGRLRIPEIGDVLIAGLTAQAAQDVITSELGKKVMTHPSVQLDVLDHTGFRYTIYGEIGGGGLFTLQNPDMRLVDVLALAGGVPQSTQNIYIIRQLPMSDSVLPSWNRSSNSDNSQQPKSTTTPPSIPKNNTAPIPNIEDLINQLDVGTVPSDESVPAAEEEEEPSSESNIDALIEQLDIGDTPTDQEHSVSPGIIQSGKHELVDIDDLVPPNHSASAPAHLIPVDIDEILTQTPVDTTDAAYIYVPESDSWIAVKTGTNKNVTKKSTQKKKESSKILERIIEIPWNKLKQGDSSYNIVIRPDDRIYVEGAPLGNLYIRGEVARPGVYDYPRTGRKITLSEFITSAGDLGPIAVPEKVSLTRRLGDNSQATITLNYAAIIQRTEPDVFLKPSDHISIGTNWGATPLAIIRNGFRTTYGFGFLLDRNFGNDVFGRPP